jgi:hypothetical protein
MAEYLVRAQKSWTEDVPDYQAKNNQAYNARSLIGDIIVVRPDGWKWGSEECLPRFVVVKIPGAAVNPMYEAPLKRTVTVQTQKAEAKEEGDDTARGEEIRIIEASRKYRIDPDTIQAAIDNKNNVITGTEKEFSSLLKEKANNPLLASVVYK